MPGVIQPHTLPGGMVQQRAPVLFNRKIARDHYRMRLKSVIAARRAKPGQFIHVLCEGESAGRHPLLRRPLSLFDADPTRGTIDFIYKVVGLGTEVLAQARSGARVDFLGPLGSAFEIAPAGRTAILVGGGVGIPPLYFLAKRIKGPDPSRASRGPAPVRIEVFLGARTKDWVICAADFRKLGLPVHAATDDGTLGHKGSVVELLRKEPPFPRKRESSTDPRVREDDKILYICGPTPMMAAAARLARGRKIPAQVSLEERMGCAMGVCMGCVAEVTTEPPGSHARFQRVCTEGPVFEAEAVAWR